MLTQELNKKYENLKNYIKGLDIVITAFSAGVDSTFLLKTADEVLKDKVTAVTVSSHLFPERELSESIEFCKKYNIKQHIIEFNPLNIKGFEKNPINRCYICKKELFTKIKEYAKEKNITNIIEGSNSDDKNDYRPGKQAIKELGIVSPLEISDLTKKEIRILSKELHLSTHDKPSFACLASRFAYGETITEDKLQMVDKAEQQLLDLGFKQVRVRIHNNMARIETEEAGFKNLIQKDIRDIVVKKFKELGFVYISLDLNGYRTGSMNESIIASN